MTKESRLIINELKAMSIENRLGAILEMVDDWDDIPTDGEVPDMWTAVGKEFKPSLKHYIM